MLTKISVTAGAMALAIDSYPTTSSGHTPDSLDSLTSKSLENADHDSQLKNRISKALFVISILTNIASLILRRFSTFNSTEKFNQSPTEIETKLNF